MPKIHMGDICEGIVTKVKPFGLFVEVNGIPGLINIPELSWESIRHPSEVASVGDRIRFEILCTHDPEKHPYQHFNGSIRKLTQD